MTKQKMIDIILEEEKTLWAELKSNIDVFGYDSSNSIINQWQAIYRLIQKLELNNKEVGK